MERAVRARIAAAGMAVAAFASAGPAFANLARNTSTASTMGEAGEVVVDTAGQHERDSDGELWTVETAAQLSLTERWEFVIEAAPYQQAALDDGDASASGTGDTDLTLSYLLVAQHRLRPALVLGGKVKLPTASEDLGTGEADYSALVVLGTELSRSEVNLELEFATFGGEALNDQFIYTFAVDVDVTENLAAYGELFGNTKPTDVESATTAAKFGLELDIPVNDTVSPYLSAEIDTEGLFAGRAGIEWTW